MKKRILLVACNNLNIGGIQHVIMSIVRNLHVLYDFDIICFDSKNSYYDDEFESYGGKIYRIPYYEGKISYLRRLNFYIRYLYLYASAKKIMKKNKYEIIHCHNAYESSIFCQVAKKHGIKIRMVHVHTSEPGWNNFNFIRKYYTKFLQAMMYKNATQLLACSDMAGKAWYGDVQSFYTIHNPVDLVRFKYSEKPIHTQNPVLLQVGLFSKVKNQLFSIDVIFELKKHHPNAKLILIGNADANAETKRYAITLKNKIHELELEDSVKLLPPDSNVPYYMENVDYLLVPSIKEGLSLVTLEGQAVGLTCFVSDALPKEVDCGNCRYLSLNSGAKTWADQIRDNYEKEHGVHKKVNMVPFSIESIMKKYCDLYEGR